VSVMVNETQTEKLDTENIESTSEASDDSNPVEKAYEEKKALNDKLEAELLRGENLRAKMMAGGKSIAGQEQLTPDEELEKKGAEGAQEIVDAFR